MHRLDDRQDDPTAVPHLSLPQGPGIQTSITAFECCGTRSHRRRCKVFEVRPHVRPVPGGPKRNSNMSILWTIIIGFVAGVIAKLVMPGDNEPSGFILTTILGIVGAFVATYLGQALGWYGPGEGSGLIGAVIGAVIVLFVYGLVAGGRRRAI